MPEVFVVPPSLQDKIKPERAPTPVADELEQRLAPVVAQLEARSPTGRHRTAAALARAIVVVRWAEVTLLGIDPKTTPERIAKAKEIVADAKKQLSRVDIAEILGGLSRHRGRI